MEEGALAGTKHMSTTPMAFWMRNAVGGPCRHACVLPVVGVAWQWNSCGDTPGDPPMSSTHRPVACSRKNSGWGVTDVDKGQQPRVAV